ncbi:MAG TPA: glucose-1-phosphate thymidylyltransferase [Candidatus Ozemobacteraceae bacterium]|nr:glucose-1-phosphate thymidylyltransferase [Candidatus Ozemobacteraceae bacterium]
MLTFSDFFKKLEGFPCPELFEQHIDGFEDITYVWDVLKRIQQGFVAKMVQPQILGIVEDGAWLRGKDIFIGRNTKVQAGAMIIGPAIIGSNVEIRHGAYIRGHVIIGDNAVVGHASELGRSVLLPDAKAPHFNYVGDSILGSHVNLGAGTKLSNLKNDGTEVKVLAAGIGYKTGMRKFGAILGDGCMLGCNSVTNPGTVMAPGCRVYPNATVSGYTSPSTIVKLRQNLATSRAS